MNTKEEMNDKENFQYRLDVYEKYSNSIKSILDMLQEKGYRNKDEFVTRLVRIERMTYGL